jgi:hypothetical protein
MFTGNAPPRGLDSIIGLEDIRAGIEANTESAADSDFMKLEGGKFDCSRLTSGGH